MRTAAVLLSLLFAQAAFAAQHTIAVVGLVHSHVWGQIGRMVSGDPAKLVGVAETAAELTAEAEKRGVPKDLIFSDWKAMVDKQKPEIVWAFVENNRHLEIVKYLAPKKIHIMFEKPLAATGKEAAEIRDIARKNGIYILTNYQMAWWPSNYTAKEVVDSGQLGKVWRIRGIVGHGGPGGPKGLNKYFFDWLTDPVKNGGGALVDFGCYNALWSLWILGTPDTVYATTNQLRPDEFPKVEDNATIILHYPKAVAVLEGSWDLPRSFQDLEIFGRDAGVYAVNGKVELRKGRSPAEDVPLKKMPPEMAGPIVYMVHCLDTKTEPAGLVGLDLNVQVVQILDAAKESLKTKKAVALAK